MSWWLTLEALPDASVAEALVEDLRSFESSFARQQAGLA